MGEELSIDNILDSHEIENLFTGDNTPEPEKSTSEDINDANNNNNSSSEGKIKDSNKIKTTEVNPDELFEEEPESVGSEENSSEEREEPSNKSKGTSPNNFYSSIASALRDEGIFPDLDDDELSKVEKPEDFRDLIDQQIRAGLDERQKRIDEALSVGMEPSEIKRYESTINYLNSIGDDAISEEGDRGENLRKNLIYQDFINRGYSKERAMREVKKSLDSGSDIEDAKEALVGNLEYYQGQYKDLIEEAKEEAAEATKERKKQFESLKSSILEDKNSFGELEVDKTTRRKILDNIAKPVYRDPDTGNYYTALQKYEMENKTDFIKNIGLLYTLTDGFKNLDALVKNKVKKEVKKGLRNLEATLNNTSRTSDGNLKYISSVNDDPESFIGKGWKLDL